MRGHYDRVDVSQEEEAAHECIDSLYFSLRELLLDQRSGGLAEPPDAKGDLVDDIFESLQNDQYIVLQDWDVFLY